MVDKELIRIWRNMLKPAISLWLLNTNYEEMGEQDKEEFERDFDEILDLALIGLKYKTQLSQEGTTTVAKTKRTFVELLVHYPHPDVCTYPEYKGKPYFSIRYKENGEDFIGYGTYNPEVLSQYLRDYFMPSAQPESKWNQCSEKLPEESGYYIVTAHDGAGHRTTFAKFQKKAKSWDLTGARSYWRVIAWMPLPEPYKGGTE